MLKNSKCPECGQGNLYQSAAVSAGGGHAPNYLPGLGGFFSAAQFNLVVCKDCGLTRFFATSPALEKLAASDKWRRV